MDDVTQTPRDENNDSVELSTPVQASSSSPFEEISDTQPIYGRPARSSHETETSLQPRLSVSKSNLEGDLTNKNSIEISPLAEATQTGIEIESGPITGSLPGIELDDIPTKPAVESLALDEASTTASEVFHEGNIGPGITPEVPNALAIKTTKAEELPETAQVADLPRPTLRKRWLALCFGLTFLFYAAQVPNFLKYSSPPTGDQPFYMMVTISLVQDHDLDLANNYVAHDEDKFYSLAPHPADFIGMSAPYPLPPHPAYTPARPANEQYNFHLPGLSLMMAPVWVMGGWFSLWWPATVIFMCFIGAVVALNIFMLSHELTGKLGIAGAVWIALAFSNPLMTYSYLIFTELTTGLLLVYAFRRLAMGWGANGPWRLILIGVCIGYIPWVAWRCVFITAPLSVYAAIQWWRHWRAEQKVDAEVQTNPGPSTSPTEVSLDNTPQRSIQPTRRGPTFLRSLPSALYIFVPIAISALGLIWYNVTLFGSFLPTNRTSELGDQSLFSWPWQGLDGLTQVAGAGFGFLFDRMYGLLIYAPIYVLAAVGMIVMFRSQRRSDRRLLFSIALVLGPYLGLMLCFFYWNGLWCPPARFMTTFAPLMAAPLALSLYALSRSWTYKVMYVLLAIPGWLSMAIMIRDPRRMWPGYPVYEWLANAPEAPVHINLTDKLPAIAPLDDKRLPGNLAWIVAVAVGIVLFSYFLLLWNERRVTKSRIVKTKSTPFRWTQRRWPTLIHALAWLLVIAIISSGWYVLNREYIKPKTQLVEKARWSLNPPVIDPDGVAFLDNKLYITGYGANGGPSIGELDLSTGFYKPITPTTPQNVALPLGHPGEIKVGPDNLLYVLNNGPGEQALYVMRPDGQVVRQVSLDAKTPIAVGLAFGEDGKVYIGDMTGGNVRKYDMGGGVPLGNWGGLAGIFNNVAGVAVDKDGTIYAAEISFQRIQKLRADGTFVEKYDINCSPNKVIMNGEWVDVTCEKGIVSINKVSGEVRQSIVASGGPQLTAPTALTYAPDGTLYVIDGELIFQYDVQH